MSKKVSYSSFYNLIKIIFAIISLLALFLRNVSTLRLWHKFFITTSILGVSIALVIINNCPIAIVGFVFFYTWYWYELISNNGYTQNQLLWKQKNWWWTLDGWQFEQEVAKVFRLNGYKTTVTRGSGDGGVDLILERDNKITIVQCKHYRTPVPPEPVRALWGCKDDFNADEVMIIASSGLTQASKEFLRNKPDYKLMTLDDIMKLSQDTNKEK